MEFREFKKKVMELNPKEKGFRKKALPYFKKLLRDMGLKNEEQLDKVANQIVMHFKVNVAEGRPSFGGDLLEDAFTRALFPTSLSKMDAKLLKESLKDEGLSWSLSHAVDKVSKGQQFDSKELHELRLKIKDVLPCIDDIVAHSAVSRGMIAHIIDGEEPHPEKVLKYYTEVGDVPEEFKNKIRRWLENKQ